MSSLFYSQPREISLVDLVRSSCLIVKAHRLDDDPKPSFSARYRVDEVLFDAYHAENPQCHVVKVAAEIQPLSTQVEAEEAASRHQSELWKQGISASVCVEPSEMYKSQLPEGERECLLFLQPILRQGKLAFRFAAFNSVEDLSELELVKNTFGTGMPRLIDWQISLSLRPLCYRLVHTFFDRLQNKQPDAALAVLHSDLHFSDPIFGDLRGPEALARWRMLVEKTRDLDLFFTILSAEANKVSVRYFLRYIDPETGRKIDHDIQAELTVLNDKIIEHKDSFSLWRFLAMKHGIRGRLLGFFPSLGNELRQQARSDLQTYCRLSAPK